MAKSKPRPVARGPVNPGRSATARPATIPHPHAARAAYHERLAAEHKALSAAFADLAKKAGGGGC